MPKVKRRAQEATFGQEVRRLRQGLGLTQQELADRLADGSQQTDISAVERGAVILPKRAKLERYARALETTAGALLEASGYWGAEEALSGHLPAMPAGAATARLLLLLEELDEGDRRVLTAVAERFARRRRPAADGPAGRR